ncbi:MAG: ribonuclease HI [Nitrospinaceae bacterium]|jgi:ribonuclease HI|nr:ribonuclease HI [Nitrospinaceae bacterium]MDP6656778.1 ribonuclease HI [Nitrospinaceae bacterium]MDP6711255.1 ribonuclease HI [Nitrospinaceae bacterium]MDP7056838.1 ribonuclease HI [Nitrospinaceae bacterium]MDP7108559.1 ribonuclease HI [Nitrospinaceae bacterium]|tara:strand:+ start:1248 stop:1697 length:450 start_codon:yes stop_codon:yes gene_type:complete
MQKIKIFTDGACRGNPGPGGYGSIIRIQGKDKELRGSAKNTTNNIMELTAAVVALKQLKEPSEVELTSDSQYLVKGMTEWIKGWIRKGWVTASKQPVKNKDIWIELNQLNNTHKITWLWVRGHTGHAENERCDQLANMAIDEMTTRRGV